MYARIYIATSDLAELTSAAMTIRYFGDGTNYNGIMLSDDAIDSEHWLLPTCMAH